VSNSRHRVQLRSLTVPCLKGNLTLVPNLYKCVAVMLASLYPICEGADATQKLFLKDSTSIARLFDKVRIRFLTLS